MFESVLVGFIFRSLNFTRFLDSSTPYYILHITSVISRLTASGYMSMNLNISSVHTTGPRPLCVCVCVYVCVCVCVCVCMCVVNYQRGNQRLKRAEDLVRRQQRGIQKKLLPTASSVSIATAAEAPCRYKHSSDFPLAAFNTRFRLVGHRERAVFCH